MAAGLPDDPKLWEEDRVIFEVCQNPNSVWAQVPNRRALEQPLKENNINGEFLLELDLETLKTELGIKSLGQRKTIMKAISLLQNDPDPPFTTHEKVIRYQQALETPEITQSRLSRLAQSPVDSAKELRPSIEQEIAQTPSMAGRQPMRSSTIAQYQNEGHFEMSVPRQPVNLLRQGQYPAYAVSMPGFMHEYAMTPAQVPTLGPLMPAQTPPFGVPQASTLPASLQPNASSGMRYDLLNSLERNINQSSPLQAPLASKTAAQPASDVISPQPKIKTRIAPTLVAHIQKPASPSAQRYLEGLTESVYFGKHAITIQDTFYGAMPGSDDELVESINTKAAPGIRGAVAHRIKKFLCRPAVPVPYSKCLARIPYTRQQCIGTKPEVLFTLFAKNAVPLVLNIDNWPDLASSQILPGKLKQKKEGAIASTRSGQAGFSASATDPFVIPIERTSESSDLGDFEYILKKYPVELDEDEALPVYGDSGDENEYDEALWDEIEAERREIQQASTTMPPDEVNATIDKAIREIKQQWIEHKLPKVQAKAYQLWMQVAEIQMRQPQIELMKKKLGRCENRLEEIRDAFVTDVWHKAAEIKNLRGSMEETINTICESKHMLQVLNSDNPPPKPDRQALKAKAKPRVELPDGEEMLDSEDDLDAFIIEDSSSAEDIPYGPEDDFQPQIPDVSPPLRRQPDAVLESGRPDAAPARPAIRHASIDNTGDEADIESDRDDRIISPTNRKRRSTISQTPRKDAKQAIRTKIEPGLPPYPSESDSDLDAPPRLPPTKYKSQGHSKTLAIDLTLSDPPVTAVEDSSSPFDVMTPPLNPSDPDQANSEDSEPPRSSVRKTDHKIPATGNRGVAAQQSSPVEDDEQLPPVDDVTGIRGLPWAMIINNSDRLRALHKGVYGIEKPDFEKLQAYIATIHHMQPIRTEILKDGLMSLRNPDVKIAAISTRNKASILLLTMLFMTYVLCKEITKSNDFSEADLHQAYEDVGTGMKKFFINLDNACKVYDEFLSATKKVKRDTKRKMDDRDLDDFIVDDSSDPLALEEEPVQPSSLKKRKRAVAESQEARMLQQSDQQRIKAQEVKQKLLDAKFLRMAANDNVTYAVNVNEPYVYLDPHIARRVKNHQINGIRFLWREIVDDPKHQGCLLAHTMGLGKTMQVISLLVTIAQCNSSDDTAVRDHIPQHLRTDKTMILCPPTLLDNWYDEMLLWLPPHDRHLLGTIRKISASQTTREKIYHIKTWAQEGGVLLLSYNLFQRFLKPPKSAQVETEQQARINGWLLESPTLVVADEAHKMKNAKAQITEFAQKFRTLSRIALTGSPLNNHLEEYHTMVDWLAPGYLGSMLQFKSKYVEPITAGLYAESTAFERRVCLKKLHILKQDLDPKVNRADISAISKDLPSKTEYFITLPLTELQREAYDIYVQCMIDAYGTTGHSAQKGLFNLISILLWLCNHPSIFIKKYDERYGRQSHVETGNETDVSDIPFDHASDDASSPGADVDDAKPTDIELEAMKRAAEVFRRNVEMGLIEDAQLSFRAVIVQKILTKAIALGDKTLLFSHSLDTLDYLQSLLDQMGCQYMRIDGKTKMSERQQITKQFNDQSNSLKVCLISTRAGGLGLNFQGASRVIIYDFSFNPMWEEQAIGRAYRLGQQRPVFVYRFRMGGTIEEVINNKAVFKTQLFSRVVDKKNPMRYASNKVSDYLFKSRDVQQRDFEADCIDTDPDVLEAVIRDTDVIRNIELTETFHKEDDEKLTEQEIEAANAEAEDERLRRDDPEAWTKKHAVARPMPTQGPVLPSGFGTPMARPFRVENPVAPGGIPAGGGTKVSVAGGAVFAQALSDRFKDMMRQTSTVPSNGWSIPTEAAMRPLADQNNTRISSTAENGPPEQSASSPGGASSSEDATKPHPAGCTNQ